MTFTPAAANAAASRAASNASTSASLNPPLDITAISVQIAGMKTALVIATALLATSAHADTTPAQKFTAAMATLNAGMGPTAEFRAPADDAATKQAVADIRDAMSVFGTPAFPVDGDNSLTTVCVPLTQIGLRYVLAGANDVPGFKDDGPLRGQSSTPAMQAQESANSVKYQDALMIFAAGNTKCSAMHMAYYTQTWNGLSETDRTARLGGVHQIRDGVSQMFLNSAMSAVQPAFSKPNRDLSIATAAAYADTFVGALPVADRASLLVKIAQVAPNLAADYPKEFATIVKALARTDCTDLCTAP